MPHNIGVEFEIYPAAVYVIEKINDPCEHLYVVLNLEPQIDETIILVNATTQHEKEERYIVNNKFSQDTLVRIYDGDSGTIRQKSTFNCNRFKVTTKNAMACSDGFIKIDYTGHRIEPSILTRLREATLISPRLDKKYRKYLIDGDES